MAEENKKIKYEQCNDCLALEQEWHEQCAKCKDGSEHLTIEDIMSDFEENNAPKPEEEKLKYFPIRWLIRLLLKYLNADSIPTWFCGFSRKPFGEKSKDDVFPFWLHVFFPFIYVNQWRDGGYTGDDFAGNLYIRLFPFVWLEFGYEC